MPTYVLTIQIFSTDYNISYTFNKGMLPHIAKALKVNQAFLTERLANEGYLEYYCPSWFISFCNRDKFKPQTPIYPVKKSDLSKIKKLTKLDELDQVLINVLSGYHGYITRDITSFNPDSLTNHTHANGVYMQKF